MKERSVQRHIAELEEARMISRVARFDESGRQMSNAYLLDVLMSNLSGRGDSPVAPEGDSAVGGEGDSPVTQTVPEGTEPDEQTGARERATEADLKEEFKEWYQHYPRKVSRGAAEKAFALAWREGALLEDLIAGVKQYAALVRGKEAEYIKHPATWLNAKCWLDEKPEPESSWWEKRLEEEREREAQASGEEAGIQ